MKRFILLTISITIFLAFNNLLKATDDSNNRFHASTILQDSIVDERDNEVYEIIKVDSTWWFNKNLNFKTDKSSILLDEESNASKLGRLYAFEEIQNICPKGWRVPTVEEFENLLDHLQSKHDSGIVNLPYNWDNVNKGNKLGFKFNKTGLKHKKKYIANESFNIWLDSGIESEAYHVHMANYDKKKPNSLALFRHEHEKKKPIKKKRKFAVRCVCEEK